MEKYGTLPINDFKQKSPKFGDVVYEWSFVSKKIVTLNSSLSILSFPSWSSIAKAILNPDWGLIRMVNKNKYSLKEKRTTIKEVSRYNYRWVVSIGGFLSNSFVFMLYEQNSAVFIKSRCTYQIFYFKVLYFRVFYFKCYFNTLFNMLKLFK